MLKKSLFIQIILHGVLFSSLFANNDAYKKGWKLFAQNDRIGARVQFNNATTDPTTKSDAYLSLSLLDWNENKLGDAFLNFQRCYESSSNPYPYLYAVSALPFLFDGRSVLPENKIVFFNTILSNPAVNGTLKAMLCDHLGAHYEKTNDFKKANVYYSKMGALSNWQVLGTFDNTSGSGFSKDWGAVVKPLTTDSFKNKVDANVNWYLPKYNKPNNWFSFDYYFHLNNSIMYAQTFVNSPTEREVYLRIGTSGSLKAWINDSQVASVSEERNCDLDIYSYKVKLNAGTNRLLIQIGSSDIDQANFLVRLTDENADPLSDISCTDVYSNYSVSTEKCTGTMLDFFAEKFFTDKLNDGSNENPLENILLAETYLRNDKAYEATKILKELEKSTGKFTLSSYLLYEAYIRANNQTDCDKEMEGIKSNDPECFFSLETKYNESVKSEKIDDAVEICKKVKVLYGESSTTNNWDINLALLQKRYEDLIALAKQMYKKDPSNYEYMDLNYQIEKNVNKNPSGAIAVIEKFCKRNNNSQAQNSLSKAYLDMGNPDKGLGVLYKRLEQTPYATGYYDNLISTLFGMQNYSAALYWNQKGMDLAPYLPNFYANKGYIYKNTNKKEEAIANFKKSIYYAPTSYDARNQLRQLENKKDVYELFPKTDLTALINKAPVAKDFPEDNAIVLLNEYQMVIYPEGAKEFRYELAVKILNKSAIERWKEYSIGYNGYSQKLIIDKTEVIKANGSIAKAETDDDNKVVFTNLEVNDALHIVYRIQDLSTGKLAKHFSDNFQFQYGLPTVINRYSLIVPDDKQFNYKVVNGDLKPEITDVENMKLYKWEMNNLPAVTTEPHQSELKEIAPTLYYSSMPNWSYVSSWYKDLTTSKFNADYVLKETVKELLKEKEKSSSLEKAKIFYNYILENITYSSVDFLQGNYIPQKASRTITTRLGDCKDLSTLFVALCREVGIEANLVLILTRDNGSNTLVLPNIGFNHCIAQLNVDNKIYYLELTDNTLPFGSALKIDLNAQILPIPFGDEKFGDIIQKLDMPNRLLNKSIRNHKVSFNKNDMTILRELVSYGAMASNQRGNFKNIGTDEQLKQINESVAKEFNVSTKVSDLSITELNSLTDSVITSYKVDVKNAVQDVAGMKIFRLPWTDMNSLDIVASETRKYPMEYWGYQTEDKTTETMIVELPQGKKLAEIPQNQKFDCKAASYSIIFDTSITNKLKVIRYFERKSDQISTNDYAAFREFLNKVSESDNKQYAFK